MLKKKKKEGKKERRDLIFINIESSVHKYLNKHKVCLSSKIAEAGGLLKILN